MSESTTMVHGPSTPTPSNVIPVGDDQPIPFTLTEQADRPFALFEEATLSPGTHLVHAQYGDLIRVAYDPAQTTKDEAGALLAVFHGLYTEARIYGEHGDLRMLNAELPHGEPLRRLTTPRGRTWVWDDQQVPEWQMLAILERVHAGTQAGE